ncbi:MAG: ACT domain-containing protein [Spirochaetota bacterium]
MDIKNKIEASIKNVINDELGTNIHPDKINTIVEKITENLSLSINPDELVLLNLKLKEKSPSEMAVVSVIGQDSVGIVADVTRILAENNANIEAMNQAIVSGYFALIITINIAKMNITIDELQTRMGEIADKKNLKIYIQHENIFKNMNRI